MTSHQLALFFSIRRRWSGQRGGAGIPAHVSLIWIMAVRSLGGGHHMGHLWGDVSAPLLLAIILSLLVRNRPLSG